MSDHYITDEAHGENWSLYLGDSCERLGELPDDSVHLSVYSPPFADLYVYSNSPRDLGNSATYEEFFAHYGYIIRENLRVTMPGRLCCVHVQQVATTKAKNGVVGLSDFRGDVIRGYQQAGWIYNGEVTVWKNPQAQSISKRVHSLQFQTLHRDSASSRPALADYLLLFRKPGDNTVSINTDATNDDWISWASPIWLDIDDGGTPDGQHLCPIWLDVNETNTLNKEAAREGADGRHICPLQLGFIERCVRLWSNPGEIVLSPFAGIGSEIYQAVKFGRQGIGVELKPSYWQTAVKNLRDLDAEMSVPTLFDEDGAA